MAQALLHFNPELALAAAQYRLDSADAARTIASIFGYKGVMFAWTSASKGHPFGCCSGKGGFENCIEQHITPDVTWLLAQIWRAFGDEAWLRSAWPVISGVADWITSRVSQTPTGGCTLRGVMPIDEWCNQTSGCATSGIDDDPQMNAVSILALRFAAEVAAVLGEDAPPAWITIADGLPLLYDEALGVHRMPVGRNNVSVIGGARSTSCPEDINYLGYPLGPALGISAVQRRADMNYWSPGTRTCLENAGMTAPIHAVNWLKVVPPNITGAAEALNRSMLAVAYGPFNVRNEVDVHATVVGGHFNNTHFITGDGGFVQILVNGHGGLMMGPSGLQLNRPTLPPGATELKLRGFRYRGASLNLTVAQGAMAWSASEGGLCLFRPPWGNGTSTPISSAAVEFDIARFFGGITDPNAAHGRLAPCTQ